MNLIPHHSPDTGNYFCTWRTQSTTLPSEALRRDSINLRDRMDEAFLFDNPGILSRFFDGIRGDLIVVLDDGWDVPYHTAAGKIRNAFGSVELNPDRFPSTHGSPAERLKQLTDRILALGYRGVGLWIACQLPYHPDDPLAYDPAEHRAYWRERASWCRYAGVTYWKVDWGRYCDCVEYRRMMTEAVRAAAPELRIEHAFTQAAYDEPYRDRIVKPSRIARYVGLMECSDYLRSYDVVPEFRYTTMFSRVAETLRLAGPSARAVINIEDAVQIGAALGCSLGIMRHASEETRVGGPQTLVTPVRDAERVLRWQRIAPPFAACLCETKISQETVTDTWEYPVTEEEQWPYLGGKKLTQSAPLAVSRGLPLPEVKGGADLPLVGVSRHPVNGAAAVGAFPRTLHGVHNRQIPANVTIRGLTADAPVGIFGEYESLTLEADVPYAGRRIYVQDCASDEAEDVTDAVRVEGSRLTLPGKLIHEAGLRTVRDPAHEMPGLVLVTEMPR